MTSQHIFVKATGLAIKSCLLVSFLLVGLLSFADDYPAQPSPPRLVNDLANVLSPTEQQQLEVKLRRYSDTTSTQIAVVTIHSLNGNDISDYAVRLAEKWGVGEKGKDNGILILAAIDDHKVFIATGKGVQGKIPDMIARRITDSYIIPNFKQRNYYLGFDQATDAIFKALNGEFKGVPKAGKKSFPLLFWLPIIIILLVIIANMFNRNSGGGGGFTGVGPYIGGAMLGGGLGGGGGGGSSGGGDFGGFGGGGFDGGGSGGSW